MGVLSSWEEKKTTWSFRPLPPQKWQQLFVPLRVFATPSGVRVGALEPQSPQEGEILDRSQTAGSQSKSALEGLCRILLEGL